MSIALILNVTILMTQSQIVFWLLKLKTHYFPTFPYITWHIEEHVPVFDHISDHIFIILSFIINISILILQ